MLMQTLFFSIFIRICGEKPPKTVYTIKSNQATVKFHSDLSYVSEGFSAEFEAFEPTNREYNHIVFGWF